MTEPNFSVNFTAAMLAAEACAIGDLLVYHQSSGVWKVATSANRAAADAGAQAIAMTAYGGSVVGKVSFKDTGIMASEVTGLSSAGSQQLVRTSSTGRLERVSSYTPGDDIVGFAEKDGRVHLLFGLPWSMISGLAGVAPYNVGTPAYPTGAPAASLANWGLTSDFTTNYLIRANYPSLYDAGEIGYAVISATDAGGGSATLNIGSSSSDVGETLTTAISGDAVRISAIDSVCNLWFAPDSDVGTTREGALFSGRVAIGHLGTSDYAEFSSTNNAAGPLLLLTRCATEPTGAPSATNPGVRIWLANPTSGGVKFQFDGGNVAVLPNAAGTLLTGNSPELTTPWIADSSGGQFYKFVVSNLTADRNVTLPLLTGADTFVFEAHTQTLTNKTITGATSVTSTYFGAGSGTLATTGLVRAANATNVVAARNAANSADCTLLGLSSSNECFVGLDTAYGTRSDILRIYANSNVYMGVGAGSTIMALSSTVFASLATNASFFDATGSFGGGSGVVFHKNAATSPTSNPTGGPIMWAEGGALKGRGTSGGLATFIPADPHCKQCGRDFAHEWEHPQHDEKLSVCMPCLLSALEGLGVPVDSFCERRLHS